MESEERKRAWDTLSVKSTFDPNVSPRLSRLLFSMFLLSVVHVQPFF